jgi:hypothetical protein
MKKAATAKSKEIVKSPPANQADSDHAPVKTALVKKLTKLREDLDLTPSDIAKKLKIPVEEVDRIEAHPKDESFDRIYNYAHALGASFDLVLPPKK